MKIIDLFYQGEGVAEIEHLEIEPDTTFADIKARLIDKHGGAVDALLFAEDEDDPIDRKFAPSATVARVKRWAAERKFGMTDEESGEHVLQIAGTHERPAPGTHIGVLANRKTCGLAFDLVADERVNGASEDRR